MQTQSYGTAGYPEQSREDHSNATRLCHANNFSSLSPSLILRVQSKLNGRALELLCQCMCHSNCRLARVLLAAVDKMAKLQEVKATAHLLQVIKCILQRCGQRVCPSSRRSPRGVGLASDDSRRARGKEPFRWGHMSGLQVGGRHCACRQDDPMAAVMHSDGWSRRRSHGLPDGSPRNGQPAAGGRLSRCT